MTNRNGGDGWGPPPPGASGHPQHGAPQHGAPQHGAPQHGAPPYGAPPYGAPQHGAPPYGPPPYGAPQHAPYGAPQQAPYGAPQQGRYGAAPSSPMAVYAHPGAGWAPGMQTPSSYKNAGILMLISGIKSAIISLILIVSLIWVCVGVFWFVTLIGAVFEIVMGAIIMSGNPSRNAKTMAIIGIVNSVMCGNIIGVALEAIALSQLGRPEVEQYVAHSS